MHQEFTDARSRRESRWLALPHLLSTRWPTRVDRSVFARSIVALTVTVSALTGCGTIHGEQKATLQQKQADLSALQQGAEREQYRPTAATFQTRQGRGFSTRRDQLPERLRTRDAIRFASAEPVSLTSLLARLTELTAISHLLLIGPEGRLASDGGEFGDSQNFDGEFSIQADFHGPLADILDRIAGQYGLAWSYEGSQIRFREFLTGRYPLAALPAQSSFSGAVGDTSSSGSINLPAEIKTTLEMIAGDGAQISYGDASGILTVTARPAAHQRIHDYLDEINASLTRQVAFDVNVLSITHRRDDQLSLNLDLFSGSEVGDSVRLVGRQENSGGETVNIGIIDGDVSLNLLLRTLDQHGDVSVETRTGATVSNNQVVPIEVVNQTAYARSTQSVTGAGGETGTSIEPATVTTGFEMRLLPRILPGGDILVRYNIELSDLNDLVEFTSDRQTIQLPRLSTMSLEQQAILGDNETLVLMGFERDRKSLNRTGNSLRGFLSGFRSAAKNERISTILTIRPRIVYAASRH